MPINTMTIYVQLYNRILLAYPIQSNIGREIQLGSFTRKKWDRKQNNNKIKKAWFGPFTTYFLTPK